jgi:hypothetical protein
LREKAGAIRKKLSPKFRLSNGCEVLGVLEAATLFSDYSSNRNPFLQEEFSFHDSADGFKSKINDSIENNEVATFEFEVASSDFSKLLGPLFSSCEADVRLRSCKAVAEVLTLWMSRLLIVTRLLPLIAEDISVVLAHLCDLYLTTVLRLCSRNAKNEKLILGVVSPNPIVTTSQERTPARSGSLGSIDQPLRTSPLFGFRRRAPPLLPKKAIVKSVAMLSANTEADVCYPPLNEVARVAKLRKFIIRGQESLSNVVNFDMVDDWLPDVKLKASESLETSMKRVSVVLEKRVCASLSSLVLAVLMDVVRSEVVQIYRCSPIFVSEAKADTGRRCDVGAIAAFCSYVDTLLLVTPKFVEVSTRISSAHATFTRLIVSQVSSSVGSQRFNNFVTHNQICSNKIIAVGGGWEEAKLNEHPNDYVDDVCQRYSLLWANLQPSNSKLPLDIVRSLWENLLQAGFLALLEGFARVSYCSTEGRSLMSMDLAAFVAGIEPWALWERVPNHEEFGPPPSVSIERGMHYVETYIKMFYFPLEVSQLQL